MRLLLYKRRIKYYPIRHRGGYTIRKCQEEVFVEREEEEEVSNRNLDTNEAVVVVQQHHQHQHLTRVVSIVVVRLRLVVVADMTREVEKKKGERRKWKDPL